MLYAHVSPDFTPVRSELTNARGFARGVVNLVVLPAGEAFGRMPAWSFVIWGALLVAVSSREWMLMLALAPITVLSILRFAMLANGWWAGWRLSVYTAVVLAIGITACLPWMPRPLDRAALLETIRGGAPTFAPDTISPDALRPVRV